MAVAVNLHGADAEERAEMAIEYKYDGIRLQVRTTHAHLDYYNSPRTYKQKQKIQKHLHVAHYNHPHFQAHRGRAGEVRLFTRKPEDVTNRYSALVPHLTAAVGPYVRIPLTQCNKT